ncbi:ubiquitin carboxyl-terminal hydrolase 8-like [Atheta coriaria]|uniref:ubiquitin carboxyl-terminal hydrolase 8-like n=1 Tax=Dalotia coriaria TaxID=877792 RepID=UPI0031F43B34
MLKPTRPLYLAKTLPELSKLCTNQSYGKKLPLLYRASDKLAQNVFDGNLDLPVDEEKLYILAMRYINLINTIRVQVHDEKFFSTRFASTLRKVEEVKLEVLKSLTLRYDMLTTPNIAAGEIKSGLYDGGNAEKLNKSNIVKDNDVYISPHQLYALMNDKTIKLLIMDARPSNEYAQCALKFNNIICLPEEIIHKGLSTNTLQQKLSPSTSEIFKTRHDFDYIVLTDLDTNKISYQTTKLHDLRTILIEWDPEQRYQTLPLILEGGVRGMADNYPTLLTNPGNIFNQLFHQFDDLMKDDIEYPDVQLLESPVSKRIPHQPDDSGFTSEEYNDYPEEVPEELEVPSGDKQVSIHAVAQRLLTVCEHQVALEEKLLKLTKKRLETKRNAITGSLTKNEAHTILNEISKEISQAESYRLEIEERRRLIRKDFDDKCQSEDVGYLDYIFKDVSSLEKKRLLRYQKRKLLEHEEAEFDKNSSKPGEPKYDPRLKPKSLTGLPIPDRSTKPQAANTLELELNALIQNFPDSGITGLVNIKNTCYMNSLVQCLRFCPSVAYFFTMRTFPIGRLTNSLSDLMKKLWTETRVAIRPHNFYNECCQLQSRDYSTGEHEDIHEFFLNVTNAMHKELAEPLESSGDCTSYLLDWHKHFKSKISFIKRTFFYQLEVTTSCSRCNSRIVKYEYDNNVFLSMDYDQQRPINVQNEVDKLIYPSKDPSSQKYCSKCEVEMNIAHRVTYYPNVLVVNIMRYTYSIKEKCVLRSLNEAYFPMELAFGSARYNLSGIACHSGNRDRGHYTACCYHPSAKKWIEFNDENCSVANVKDSNYRVRAFLLFYSLAPQYDGINRQFFQK